jgi:GMP synthase (glutamine-hydrolysing)
MLRTQYLAHFSGGEVAASNTREYGRANLNFIKENEVFFEGVSENSQVWMSHSDSQSATSQWSKIGEYT